MLPILTADDFGMTDGVSRAILELGHARRLSATSAMTNMPAWPGFADELRALRSHMSLGLHLNLTLGVPLTRSPLLTRRDGTFRGLSEWIVGPFDRLGHDALTAEIEAQLWAFVDALGFLPDHIDGHQHVHLMPGVRARFFDALSQMQWQQKPLIRDATATSAPAVLDTRQRQKALAVKGLGLGFRSKARRLGYGLNQGFAGFSNFEMRTDYAIELTEALKVQGVRAIVMCHPGHVDEALRQSGDAVVGRRAQEFDALMALPDLPRRIWHAARSDNGPTIGWNAALTGVAHAR